MQAAALPVEQMVEAKSEWCRVNFTSQVPKRVFTHTVNTMELSLWQTQKYKPNSTSEYVCDHHTTKPEPFNSFVQCYISLVSSGESCALHDATPTPEQGATWFCSIWDKPHISQNNPYAMLRHFQVYLSFNFLDRHGVIAAAYRSCKA